MNWCSPAIVGGHTAVDFPFVASFPKFASVPTHVPFIAGFSKFVSVPVCCWIPSGTGVPAALDVPYIDATPPPSPVCKQNCVLLASLFIAGAFACSFWLIVPVSYTLSLESLLLLGPAYYRTKDRNITESIRLLHSLLRPNFIG
jgi:hypothetical protein